MATGCPRRRAAALAVCAAALASCAGPVRLSRADLAPADPGDEEADRAAAPAPGAVPIAIAPVEDRRVDPSNLGQLGSRTFTASELKGFLDEQLARLASRTFYVAKVSPPGAAPQLTLRPRILKAYVSGVDVTKSAVVVLEVEFAPGGAASAPTSRVFRGQDASMNWGNGQGEVASALQRATASCLEQLRAEIERRVGARAGPT